jgi:hypothetical protein
VTPIRAATSTWLGFRSLTEAIDTTNGGRLVFHVFAATAEFERRLIQERVMAGFAAARAKGNRGGRKPALTAEQARQARITLSGGAEVSTVARGSAFPGPSPAGSRPGPTAMATTEHPPARRADRQGDLTVHGLACAFCCQCVSSRARSV